MIGPRGAVGRSESGWLRRGRSEAGVGVGGLGCARSAKEAFVNGRSSRGLGAGSAGLRALVDRLIVVLGWRVDHGGSRFVAKAHDWCRGPSCATPDRDGYREDREADMARSIPSNHQAEHVQDARSVFADWSTREPRSGFATVHYDQTCLFAAQCGYGADVG